MVSDLLKIAGGVSLVVAGFSVAAVAGWVVLGLVLVMAGWLLED